MSARRDTGPMGVPIVARVRDRRESRILPHN